MPTTIAAILEAFAAAGDRDTVVRLNPAVYGSGNAPPAAGRFPGRVVTTAAGTLQVVGRGVDTLSALRQVLLEALEAALESEK